MTGQQIAFLITALSHVGAVAVLLTMLVRLGASRPQDGRDWPDDDDGREDDPRGRPLGGPRGGGLPLPDASSSPLRVRGPGLLVNRPAVRSRQLPRRRPAPQRDPRLGR